MSTTTIFITGCAMVLATTTYLGEEVCAYGILKYVREIYYDLSISINYISCQWLGHDRLKGTAECHHY